MLLVLTLAWRSNNHQNSFLLQSLLSSEVKINRLHYLLPLKQLSLAAHTSSSCIAIMPTTEIQYFFLAIQQRKQDARFI